MNDLISIIVPVYNVEKYLPRCIDSILMQTYSNFEVILVNDGSEDGSGQICDEYAAKDSRIKVIHQSNAGVAAARNVALRSASGDYLGFVDSDDYISSDMCEKVMKLFNQYDVDVVTFDCCRVAEDGKELGRTETLDEGILSQENALAELMRGHMNNYMWNKVFKRRVFEGIRFPEGRVWEDMAITHQLFLSADKLYCTTDILYYYCARRDSIIATIGEKALGDIYLARYNSYTELKEIYPHVAELVFPRVALCARRLFDRSLWANVDATVLERAQAFLAENREKVLKQNSGIEYKMYYQFPKLYAFLRLSKHKLGNLVKRINKKDKPVSHEREDSGEGIQTFKCPIEGNIARKIRK